MPDIQTVQGLLICVDNFGQPVVGRAVHYRMIEAPAIGGVAWDGSVQTATSVTAGETSLTLAVGAKYAIWSGGSNQSIVTATASETPLLLPDMLCGDGATVDTGSDAGTVDISGKADKVADATVGNFAALDATGNLTDSGFDPSTLTVDLSAYYTSSQTDTLLGAKANQSTLSLYATASALTTGLAAKQATITSTTNLLIDTISANYYYDVTGDTSLYFVVTPQYWTIQTGGNGDGSGKLYASICDVTGDKTLSVVGSTWSFGGGVSVVANTFSGVNVGSSGTATLHNVASDTTAWAINPAGYFSGTSFTGTSFTGTTFTGTTFTGTGLTVDTNTLHVNSTTHRVGVGTTSPAARLNVYSTGTGGTNGTNNGIRASYYSTQFSHEYYFEMNCQGFKADDWQSIQFSQGGYQVMNLANTESNFYTNNGTLALHIGGPNQGNNYIGVNTLAPTQQLEVNGGCKITGLFYPKQATTAAAPAYVKGAIYFDTTLNKLRVGGATAWETITSA